MGQPCRRTGFFRDVTERCGDEGDGRMEGIEQSSLALTPHQCPTPAKVWLQEGKHQLK